MNRSISCLAVLTANLILLGCAAPAVNVAAADPDQQTCTLERRTGSNIPVTVCLSRAEREQQQRDAADTLTHMRPGVGSRVGQ